METNKCKKYWKISVRIGPLFQAPIKGPTSNEFDKIVMQPSLHRDLQMQCQFETCGDRHVLVSALKRVGGAKCQFEDLFVYHTMPKLPTSTKLFLSKLSVTWHFGQVVATKVLHICCAK